MLIKIQDEMGGSRVRLERIGPTRILEAGLLDLEQMDYPNIPKRRRAAFRRKVKARYADLLLTTP